MNQIAIPNLDRFTLHMERDARIVAPKVVNGMAYLLIEPSGGPMVDREFELLFLFREIEVKRK